MSASFGRTVKRVFIGHVVIIGGVALAPFLRGCTQEEPEHILPITFVTEAAAAPSAPPAPPAPADPAPPPPEPDPLVSQPTPPDPAPVAPPKRREIQRSTKRITRGTEPPPQRSRVSPPSADQVRRMLGPSPSTATHTAVAAGEDQRNLALVQRTMYNAWVQPVSAGLTGTKASVTFDLGAQGRVRNVRIKSASGQAELDRSVLAAVESVQAISGLPSDFIDRHPMITIVFEVR